MGALFWGQFDAEVCCAAGSLGVWVVSCDPRTDFECASPAGLEASDFVRACGGCVARAEEVAGLEPFSFFDACVV